MDNFNDFPIVVSVDTTPETYIPVNNATGWQRTPLSLLMTAIRNVIDSRNNAETIPGILLGGDHPYDQYWGTDGTDGLAAMYNRYGVVPYIAINTDNVDGPGAPGMMTWAQLRALIDRGWVYAVSHGHSHVDKWNRINSGIQITYNGTNAAATVQVQTAVPSTALVCTSGSPSADTVTSTFSTDTTLAAVKATIEASGKWTMTLDPILTGNESSTYLLGMNAARALQATGTFSNSSGLLFSSSVDYPTGAPVKFKTSGGVLPANIIADTTYYAIRVSATTLRLATTRALAVAGTAISYVDSGTPTNYALFPRNNFFCISGGFEIRYNDTNPPTYSNHVWVRRNSSANFSVFMDGVIVYNHAGSTGSLATLIANVNAIQGGEFFALACDNGYTETITKPTYFIGDELETNLSQTTYQEFASRPTVMEAGLPQWYIIERQMEYSYAQAMANGVTLKHFAQSGGNFYPWMTNHARYGMFRGNPYAHQNALSIMRRDAIGNFISHRALTNAETGATFYGDNIAVIPAAMAGHGVAHKLEPWFTCLLMHALKADGTSGFAISNTPSGYFDQYEADWHLFLKNLRSQADAGLVNILTFDQLQTLDRSSAPRNGFFNPTFLNGGAARLPAAGASDAYVVPGWLLTRPSTMSTLSIANGVISVVNSSATATEFLSQEVDLIPGKRYKASVYLDVSVLTSGAGLQLSLQSLKGNVRNLILPSTNYKITGPQRAQSGEVEMQFVVPPLPTMAPAVVRALYLVQTCTFTDGAPGLVATFGTSIPALSRIRFSSTTLLPTGLALYTDYWTITTGTATKLATSLANAIAATAIAFTDAGTATISGLYIPTTYKLDVVTDIKINVLGIGATADINCAGATPAATTPLEIAAKINAAMAATALYANKPEYHTIASVIDGVLTLTAPYLGTDQISTLTVTAGTSSAVAAIFGNATVTGYSQFLPSQTAENYPWRIAVRAALQGTYSVTMPVLQPLSNAGQV